VKMFRVGGDIRARQISSGLFSQSIHLQGLFHKELELTLSLIGKHQITNAATAVGAVEALLYYGIDITKTAIAKGLESVTWPGRLETLQQNPLVVLDCAKDPFSVNMLTKSLSKEFRYKRLILVVSISSDKRIEEMIRRFSPVVDYFIVTHHSYMGRGADTSRIASAIEENKKQYEVVPEVNKAIDKALYLADEKDMICIAGSVFLVGEAREYLGKAITSFYSS
ncbi:MAG: glutamate ligase domain-containing protein, partial [Candidatus Ranarchaeia archaeon]